MKPEKDGKPQPQVLLSGSLAVQAALGRVFEGVAGNIDIFCTWEAAPYVRERLVERCGLNRSGVATSYKGDRELMGELQGSSKCYVSHFEGYSARPTFGKTYGAYGGDGTDPRSYRYDSDESDDGDVPYDYEQALAWGQAALKDGFYVGVPGGSAGGKFAYDRNLNWDCCLQLIIGERGVTDARMLLDSFDMEICKCSYDGTRFRVPAPENTFAGRTKFMPQQRAIIADFMRHVNVKDPKKKKKFRAGGRATDKEMAECVNAISDESWAGFGIKLVKEFCVEDSTDDDEDRGFWDREDKVLHLYQFCRQDHCSRAEIPQARR